MAHKKKQPDPKRAAAIRAGLERRRARGGKLGRSFQYTPEQVAAVVRLREQGLSWSEISSELSVPISTARTLYLRGVANMSNEDVAVMFQTSVPDMREGIEPQADGHVGLSPAALSSLVSLPRLRSPADDASNYVADLSPPDEVLLSMVVAYEPRLGQAENLERTRSLLSMLLDLPPRDDAEAGLPECPDPRQRVWALSEINAVRRLLSDGLAQLKIAKTVNASPNDISAIKQERIDRVRGGYIVHRTKVKMQRYRASLSR